MSIQVNGFTFNNLDSIEEVQSLKAEVTKVEYDGLSDREIARVICLAPQIANPVAVSKVPDPAKVNVVELLKKLTDAELALIPMDSLQRVADDIGSLNILESVMALRVWKAHGCIDQSKHDILAADLTAVIDDPKHRVTVAGTSKLSTAIGREVGGITEKEVKNAKEI